MNTWVDDQQTDPQVAALATGGFVVIWRSEDQDFSGGGIYGQRYSSSGVQIGNEFQVNTVWSGQQGEPAVAATPDGGFVVSWLSSPIEGIGNLYSQQYDAAGLKVGNETLINDAFYQNDAPSVTALVDGSLVHTWTGTDSGPTEYGGVWSLLGPTRIESKRIELRANTPLEVLQPTVALEAAEFKSVIYRVEDNLFFDPDLPYGDSVTFDAKLADGSSLPAWLAFDSNSATLSGLPLSGQVGTLDVRITAADLSGAVGESIITITVGAAADVTVTAAPATYTVNTTEPLLSEQPDAVVLVDGTRIVVWGADVQVRGQRFAADGSPISGEVRIDTSGVEASHAGRKWQRRRGCVRPGFSSLCRPHYAGGRDLGGHVG